MLIDLGSAHHDSACSGQEWHRAPLQVVAQGGAVVIVM